jgi:hypothetical protein
MRIYRRLPIMQSGIAARCRKLWLIAASTLASAFLGVSEPALAQPFGPGTFTSNINVNTPNLPITLTLQPPVIVNSPGGDAVNAANAAPAPLGPAANITIKSDGSAPIIINNSANPGDNQTGLRIQSGGDAIIRAPNTTINLNGTGFASNNAIWAIAQGNATATPQVAQVTWSGLGTGAGITSRGANSTGIQASNRGFGDATIDASGNTSGMVGTPGGFTFLGLDAVAGDTTGGGVRGAGNASVIYSSGTINVQGNFTAGIFASANVGSATITTLPGTSIIVSQQFSSDTLEPGVDAFSANGNATDNVASTILINGGPAVPATNYKSNPTAIRAASDLSGDVSVAYTGPGITVHGGGALGIVADAGSPDATTQSGSVSVNASGPINTTDSSNAVGILADSGFIRNVFTGGRAPTTITGPVNVTASNVSALGQFGTAISATGGSGGVSVNIPSGGLIMGGWQPDVTSVGVTYGLPAAGVVLVRLVVAPRP